MLVHSMVRLEASLIPTNELLIGDLSIGVHVQHQQRRLQSVVVQRRAEVIAQIGQSGNTSKIGVQELV